MKLESKKLIDIMNEPESELIEPDNLLTLENIYKRFPSVKLLVSLSKICSRLKCKQEAFNCLTEILADYVGWYGIDSDYSTNEPYDLVVQQMVDNMTL